jgi:hypothetical protein
MTELAEPLSVPRRHAQTAANMPEPIASGSAGRNTQGAPAGRLPASGQEHCATPEALSIGEGRLDRDETSKRSWKPSRHHRDWPGPGRLGSHRPSSERCPQLTPISETSQTTSRRCRAVQASTKICSIPPITGGGLLCRPRGWVHADHPNFAGAARQRSDDHEGFARDPGSGAG